MNGRVIVNYCFGIKLLWSSLRYHGTQSSSCSITVFSVQLNLLHKYYIVRSFWQLHAENVKQLFCMVALPDDGPVRPETWKLVCCNIMTLIKVCAFVGSNCNYRNNCNNGRKTIRPLKIWVASPIRFTTQTYQILYLCSYDTHA